MATFHCEQGTAKQNNVRLAEDCQMAKRFRIGAAGSMSDPASMLGRTACFKAKPGTELSPPNGVKYKIDDRSRDELAFHSAGRGCESCFDSSQVEHGSRINPACRLLRTRRPLPDDIRDLDWLRDQSKTRKTVGNGLLAPDDLLVDRNNAVVRAPDKAPDGFDVDAGRRCLGLRDLFVMCIGPNTFGGEDRVEARHEGWIFLDEVRAHDDESRWLIDLLGEEEHARIALQFCQRKIGIPDCPGVDRSLGKGRRRVRGREWNGLDVAPGNPGLLQRRHQQIMRARYPAEGDALALEIGQRLDRRT